MESIRYIIKFFLKVAIALFFFAIVWWVIALLFPVVSIGSITQSIKGEGEDWLPAPRNYSGLLKNNSNGGTNGNLYVPGPAYTPNSAYVPNAAYVPNTPYSGYGAITSPYTYSSVKFVTYTADGREVVTTTPNQEQLNKANSNTAAQAKNTTYIRNLSIYANGSVYTGLTFVGEARSELFNEGKFPIIVVDNRGMIVGVSTAVATTKWTTPGWVRFQTKINHTLPVKVACNMVFEESLTQEERSRQPLRSSIPITCN